MYLRKSDNRELENEERIKLNYKDLDEQTIFNIASRDFEYQIKKRGMDYYYSDRVSKVIKSKNKYVGKVYGSMNNEYNTLVEILDDEIKYNCTCPCTYPCKHAFALLYAINDCEYIEVELKDEIEEKKENLKATLEKIPAEKLKRYMIAQIGTANINFEKSMFNNYFRNYLPKQSYVFYYNNLYNLLVLDDNFEDKLDYYMNLIKQYIRTSEWKEAFKIIKAIIEAYHDSKLLNTEDYIIEQFTKIQMTMRIIYMKIDNETKKDIDNWIEEIKKEDYYGNIYLEDMIFNLESIC